MAAAAPQPDSVSHVSEALSGHATDEYEADEENRMETSQHSYSVREKDRKIGHRRVDKSGIVSYKKKPTSELMAAIQLGIGQSVGGLSAKPERDVLMQDFGVVEVVFFPGEGSNLTPAHHYSDFRFKTYAPVAFRYFRDLFGIQPDDFMLSLCDEPLKELSNPGASGSIFYLTQDDEFIIKTVQHKEADFLQKLLPGYFLCGGKNIRFIVMNNLLPSTVKLHEKYDMKGSTYKRKASKHERVKTSPTLKDLDFMENHIEGLMLEKDTYDALIKTMQRDCRVLESFKIMDYSLLVGIYNLDLVKKEKQNLQNTSGELYSGTDTSGTNTGSRDGQPPSGYTGLQRGKSFKTRIGQYSTPMESIQGNTDLTEDLLKDMDVPPGGIPARNAKGEQLLLYLGIIDILQSFRLKKRLEHTVKSMVIDGDTISVHRPGYYANRFLQYHATRVFKKSSTGLKHSPSKKKSIASKIRNQPPIPEQPESGGGTSHRSERTGRTISFSDETPVMGSGAVGGKPDLLPEYSAVPGGSSNSSPMSRSPMHGVNGNTRQQKRSEAFNISTYPSEDALSAGTASAVSLRGVGVSSTPVGHRGTSPPLSLSESTPTHTDFTEGMPSYTNSSPSCSSDVMGSGHSCGITAITSTSTTTSATATACHAASRFTISARSAMTGGVVATAVPTALSSPTPSTFFAFNALDTTNINTISAAATMDMGSTSLLDATGKESPARSQTHSPDKRQHTSKSEAGGTVSPLARSLQSDIIDEVTAESSTAREPDEPSGSAVRVSVVQGQPQKTSTFTTSPVKASASESSAASQKYSELTLISSSSTSQTVLTVGEITASESEMASDQSYPYQTMKSSSSKSVCSIQ